MKKGWKRILSGALCAAVVMAGTMTGNTKAKAADAEEAAKKAYALPVQSNETEGWPAGPAVYGTSAIVMDADTKAVLYAKNIDERHAPASITKVLTALLAAENGNLDTDKVLFSQESVDFLEPGDAYIAMRPGEEITLKDAVYGMLLASANEVSYAIAENIGNKLEGAGGGYEKFIAGMNKRAKELGAKNTNFMNPHGLFEEQHYTSVYDMAVISAELFWHPELLQIMQTGQYEIPPTNLEKESRIFQQKHRMLIKGGKDYYEYCVGGKTGYTDESGNTLVTLADNGKQRLVCVEMETRGQHIYDDTKNLLDYGFQNFAKKELPDSVIKKAEKELNAKIEEGMATLPADADIKEISCKLESSESNGEEAVFTYKNQRVGKVKAEKKEIKEEKTEKKKEILPKISFPKPDKKILAGAGAAAVLLLILILVFCFRRKRGRRGYYMKHRRKRLAQERRRQRKIRRKADRARRKARRKARKNAGRVGKRW